MKEDKKRRRKRRRKNFSIHQKISINTNADEKERIEMCFLIVPSIDQGQTKKYEQPGQLYSWIHLCYVKIFSTFI